MSDRSPTPVSPLLVDARGKACPLPIVELARALRGAPAVELWADDPAAEADVHAFCQATGHRLLTCHSTPGHLVAVVIRR